MIFGKNTQGGMLSQIICVVNRKIESEVIFLKSKDGILKDKGSILKSKDGVLKDKGSILKDNVLKGSILKEVRTYAGITQEAMGEKLGCSNFVIRRYENGITELTDEVIEKICAGFNIDKQVFDELEQLAQLVCMEQLYKVYQVDKDTQLEDATQNDNRTQLEQIAAAEALENKRLEILKRYCHYVPDRIDYKEIGLRVRKFRESLNLDRDSFAAKAGVSVSSLTKLELNFTNPSDSILKKIADGFDVGFDWIKYGDERVRVSPVNQKLIEWLNDNQEVRNELWKRMRGDKS